MYETDSSLKRARITRLRTCGLCARPQHRRGKRYPRAPKARAEKNWDFAPVQQKIEELRPLVYEKDSFSKALQNHALANALFLSAPQRRREKRYSRAPKARAEKIWRFCFKCNKIPEETRPLLYVTGDFSKTLQNRALAKV